MTMRTVHPDDDALAVLRRLRRAGHETYFVGGCVRDMALGREPSDWDIATAATPDEVERLFDRTVPVGKAFGVMLVVVEEKRFEVATFRVDAPASDGRRPESVEFCSAREDVLRRDFTVNALLYDPEEDRVVDHVGGRDDIRDGVVRAVGEPRARFLEDHLRILRAVRFAAGLGFRMDDATSAAVSGMAGLVRRVSAERVAEEMERMLTRGAAGDSVRLMERNHLLFHVLPEVQAMRGTPQPPEFHPEGDVLTHTCLMLDRLETGCDARLGWAALLHDIGKPDRTAVEDRIRSPGHASHGAQMARNVLERLKRSRDCIDDVAALIHEHMRFASLDRMREAKRRRWLRDPLFPLHMELHRIDCLASHGRTEQYESAKAAWEEETARPEPPPRLVNGDDLIELGYEPGPAFGRALSALEDAQLEGAVTTREGALDFVRERLDE